MRARAPERTLFGSDSVTATMMVAEDNVRMPFSTALTVNKAVRVRNCSRIQNDGYMAMINSNQGMIISGLRPKRSDSQPPSVSHTSPLAPMAAVAPKDTAAGMARVLLAYVVMYSST